MRGRGALLLLALVSVALWPSASGAQVDPATGPTVPPIEPQGPTDAGDEPEEPAIDTTVEPDGASPEGGARTLTVTPHNNLVHDQVVVVRGRGWRPRDGGQGAAQCISGTSSIVGCGQVVFQTTDAAGNFRIELEVDVILETGEGTFDCRIEVCVIGANNSPVASGSRFVELHFDPAGPDPVRRTVTVDPDTDLVDHQDVTITGDDFEADPRFGGYAELYQCRLPAAGNDDCDPSTYDFGDVDGTGHFETSARVEALLHLEDGSTHDCRTGGCVLSVQASDEGFAEGAQAPLAFDPVAPLAPPPSATATPSTGLVDGQIIRLTGADWRPDSYLVALLCPSTATDYGDCDNSSYAFAPVESDGTFSLRVALRAKFRVDGGRYDCRIGSCSFFVTRGEFEADLSRSVEVPLDFDPSGRVIEPAFTTGALDGLHGGDGVRVAGRHGRPNGRVELIQCLASARDRSGCGLRTRQYAYAPFDGGGFGAFGGTTVGVRWSVQVRLRQFLHLEGGRLVNCHHANCALVAVDAGGRLTRSDRIATAFEAR